MIHAMAINVTQLQSHLDAARSAIASGNYDTALTQAMAARACLAGIPNASEEGASVDWKDRANEITALIADINSLKASSSTTGGIQTTKLTYTRVGDC
jgi:hypothetical protein